MEQIKTTLEELSDTFSSQLGKYMNREYKIFKTEKGLVNKLFSSGEFKPTAEIIGKAERVYRTAITQAWKNSERTKKAAVDAVERRAAQRQTQPMTSRRDPLIERERKISKQKAIDEELDRMAKDYFENTAPKKAADAV